MLHLRGQDTAWRTLPRRRRARRQLPGRQHQNSGTLRLPGMCATPDKIEMKRIFLDLIYFLVFLMWLCLAMAFFIEQAWK
jgi:hypothetical protein